MDLLPVKVQPRARREGVMGWRDGALLVSVLAPPEDGKANDAVIALLSKALSCSRRELSVERGHSVRHKLVRVPMPLEEVRQRLEAFGVPPGKASSPTVG